MMGKTHKIGGALAGVAVSRILYSGDYATVGAYASLIIGSVLGSLLPDIDKKESTIGRILWFISWPIFLLRITFRLLARILPGALKRHLKEIDEDLGHRGIAHSLITWLVFSVILYFSQSFILRNLTEIIDIFSKEIVIDPVMIKVNIFAFLFGVSVGMLSHILLDIFTNSGVAIFSPFIDKKIKVCSIKTGSIAESVIRKLMTAAVVVILYDDLLPYLTKIKEWLPM